MTGSPVNPKAYEGLAKLAMPISNSAMLKRQGLDVSAPKPVQAPTFKAK